MRLDMNNDQKREKYQEAGYDDFCQAHQIPYLNECPECAELAEQRQLASEAGMSQSDFDRQQPGKVLRWVKASERLPEKDAHICFKISEGYTNAYVVTRGNGRRAIVAYSNNEIKNWKIGEWLEESEDLSAPASPVEERPDSFVEWLTEEIAEAQKFHEYAEDEIQANYWKGARDAKIDVKMEYESLAKPSPVIEIGEQKGEIPEEIINWIAEEFVKPENALYNYDQYRAGAIALYHKMQQEIAGWKETASLINKEGSLIQAELSSARTLILNIKIGNIYQEPADECDKWLKENIETK